MPLYLYFVEVKPRQNVDIMAVMGVLTATYTVWQPLSEPRKIGFKSGCHGNKLYIHAMDNY